LGKGFTGRVGLALIALLALLTPVARGAERVTLRNGFEVRCDHHAEVEGRTRLYLSAGEDNYIEFKTGEIAGVETVADEPVAATPKAAQGGPSAAPRLTPADVGEMLARAGHARNLDVDLLASLVKAESGGNARAVSRAGAQGLMQLMPKTALDLGVGDRLQPEENVRGGATYLDELLTRYHENMALALAAYNAGPAAVDKYHGIPPYRETRVYVARVIHEFNRRVAAREKLARAQAVGAQVKAGR